METQTADGHDPVASLHVVIRVLSLHVSPYVVLEKIVSLRTRDDPIRSLVSLGRGFQLTFNVLIKSRNVTSVSTHHSCK